MGPPDVGTTDPSLLRRVREWKDHPAWSEFVRRYDPLLRCWCRRLRFDAEQAEEFCQQFWVELLPKMEAFRFDPGRRFRSWLWTVFRHRVIDRDRLERNRARCRPLDEAALEAPLLDDPGAAGGSEGEDDRPALLALAEAAQEAVRAKVQTDTWRAFWLVAIEGRPVREAADELGMKYAAVYVAHRRVAQRLREEGRRLRAGLDGPGQSSGSRAPGRR